MRRGDIYYADLGQTYGSEQGGLRPIIIIQNDIGNRFSGTVIIAPITSRIKASLPTHVFVNTTKIRNSIVLLEQIRTIDKDRLQNYIGHVSDEIMEKVDEALKVSLGLNAKKKRDDTVNDLQVFDNKEMGLKARTILNNDGSISVNAEDTAIGFGWTQTQNKNGKQYISIRWETLNGYCSEFGFPNKLGKDDYIPESLFYRLGMKANNPAAEKFQNWLAMDVIPSIRKTGRYQFKKMTPEEMMRVQLGMLDGHEERISKLENTMNIDYGQQRVLEKEVAKVVIDSLGGKDSVAYKEIGKKVFSECNHDVKDYFHVNSRNNIPRSRFDDAVGYIREWQPCTNTKVAIRECNVQV